MKPTGFSLVELIAILVIASILFVVALSKLPENNLTILQSKRDVIVTLRHARQLALIRGQTDTDFAVVFTRNSIDLHENNNSIDLPGKDFPIIFPSGLTITQGLGTLYFDRLGNTRDTQIQLSDSRHVETIDVSGVGYAR